MMATEIYVFAILGGVAVLALFGWVLWIAGSELFDMARHRRRERQWLLERRERAAWSPGLGARCWLLDVANDPASGGRACTVVLRDDTSGEVLEVAATDPRIYRGLLGQVPS